MAEAVVHHAPVVPVARAASRAIGGWTFDVLPVAEAAAFRARWAALADASAGDNVFFHPDFVLPAARYLAPGVEVATLGGRDGRLVAAAPFRRTRLGRLAPAVRLWSHDYAPLGLPLIDGTVVGAAAEALVEGLAPSERRGSLIVPDLPTDSAVAAALAAAAARQGRPVDVLGHHRRAVFLRGDTRLSAKRAKKFARQRELLAEATHGDVAFETAITPSAVRRAFDEFLALEKSGWKGAARTALGSNAASEAFAAEAVGELASHGGVRIDALTAAGRAVAMLVTLTAGKTAFTWKIAYDEAFARFSPGAQVMAHAAAAADGPLVERVDSCAKANHPMVDTLWSSRMEIATFVIGPPGGSLANRAGVLAARAEIAARARARAALRR